MTRREKPLTEFAEIYDMTPVEMEWVEKLADALIRDFARKAKPGDRGNDGSQFDRGYECAIADMVINIRKYWREQRGKK